MEVLSLRPGETSAAHEVSARHRLRGLAPALLSCDVLVSGGGGLIQDATSGRSLTYYLGVIRAARALRRRVLVYGQSLGPLSEGARRRVARVLRGVPLGLRDAASLALARALGLPATEVADAALALPVPRGESRDALVLVPRGGSRGATDALVALGEAALARGTRVETLALHPARDEAERARLAAALPGCEELRVTRPLEALAALAGARLVASVRLHGLILACVAGVPHVGLAYDPKVQGFAERSRAACFPSPRDAAEARALSASLVGVLAAPTLDLEARDRLRSEAEVGLDWLVRSALIGPSSASAYTTA